MIRLTEELCFSQGGNRICYVHPDDRGRCLKVNRSDRTPQIRRAEKGLLGKLRPLEHFDENICEAARLQFFHGSFGEKVSRHLPRSYGIVETSEGPAHETDLIRDEDGRISQTLEQHLWHHGMDATASAAIKDFLGNWASDPPPTRDLIPHNMVLQLKASTATLILIDGYGRQPNFFRQFQRKLPEVRWQRREDNLYHRIEKAIRRGQSGEDPFNRISNLNRDL